MAVLETIRSFFGPVFPAEPEVIVPAPNCVYEIHTLTTKHLAEVLKLNIRCFCNGDNYTKHTFSYLLSEPRTLSYRVATQTDEIVDFAFVMVNDNGSAHLTTIGVAPEHRRRGIAVSLIEHLESALRSRSVGTIMLEVRVGNTDAQMLYRRKGFITTQRIGKYYTNGEDCYLMIKALN